MIDFQLNLLQILQNYLLCSLGLCLVYALIKFTEPQIIKKPSFWYRMMAASLLGLLPFSIYIEQGGDAGLPLSWLSPIRPNHLVQESFGGLASNFVEHINLATYVIILYVYGCCYFLVKLLLKLLVIGKIIRQSAPFDLPEHSNSPLIRSIDERKIALRISNYAVSPFTFTLLRNYIVVPSYFKDLDEAQANLLLEHELTHLKYYDPQMLLLSQFMASILWFNPLNWFYLNQLNQAMEHRVDEFLIQQKKYSAKFYAFTLLDIIKRSVTPSSISSCATGLVSAQKQQVKQRIFSMLNTKNQNSRKQAKSITCWSFILLSWPLFLLTAEAEPGNHKPWIFPLQTSEQTVTSKFKAVHEIRNNKPHLGVDLKAELGTNIVAPNDGKVIIADGTSLHPNYGNVIVIQHNNGLRSFYAHLDSFKVAVGDRVKQGDVIGQVGVTGKSTGPHLHMEVILDKTHLDPLNFITLGH
jgi:murein DD-endopeptidase MepM/ murein hydrolase activator NlpD